MFVYKIVRCCVGSYLRIHTLVFFLTLIISNPPNAIKLYFDKMLSMINCTSYQSFMRFYKMVRLLSLVKSPGMEPVCMILPLTYLTLWEYSVYNILDKHYYRQVGLLILISNVYFCNMYDTLGDILYRTIVQKIGQKPN